MGTSHTRRRACRASAAALVACLAAPVAGLGQDPEPPDSIRRELEALRAQVDSLREALRRLEAAARPPGQPGPPGQAQGQGGRQRAQQRAGQTDDPLARLRAAAEAAAGQAEATAGEAAADQEVQFTGRQRALQALNPELSVGGDMIMLSREGAPTDDNLVVRSVEFALQATLDPYSRAKVIASAHGHGGGLEPFAVAEEHEHEGGIAVEEAYAQWVNLRGGHGLTIGLFRQKLGTYNRWHEHALPWQSLPLPYTVLLGPEGLAQAGVSFYWLAPFHGLGTYEVWVQGTRSSNHTLFGESTGPSVLGHLNAFYEISPAVYLELGLSAVAGDYETDVVQGSGRVTHYELGLNWRPPGREHTREVTFRAALLQNRGPGVDLAGAPIPVATTTGGFAFVETRLSRSWLAGLRYDRVSDPLTPGQDAWILVPTLTWWQSEFVRARAEYDWLHAPDGLSGQLLVQLSFAMGPHKHDTY